MSSLPSGGKAVPSLADLIREATWCHCTNFTAEQGDAIRRAEAVEAELAKAYVEIDRLRCR